MKDLINSKHLLIPSWVELMVYSVGSFIFIIYARFEHVLVALTGEKSSEELRQELSTAFERLVEQFLQTLEASHLTASILVGLFWAGVGITSYLLVMWFQKSIIETEEDLVMEMQYVHPKNYKHYIFWLSFFARVLFRVSIVVLIAVYAIFVAQVLIPLWLERVEAWLLNLLDLAMATNALLGFIGLIVTIHIFVVLLRLVFIRNRIINY
jgi:hypothetical protein